MSLKGTYAYSVDMAQKMGLSSIEERDGKLHFNGVVNSEDEKNQIWNAIKASSGWQQEVVGDIRVEAKAAAPAKAGAAAPQATYTVKAGDTLSKIAKEHLGNANAYMEIFNANRDQLTDPDKIKPGQVLKLPVATT